MRDHVIAATGLRSASMRRNKRADARGELMQRDILRKVIVGAEAQARDHVEIGVARGQEQDRQRRRLRAQAAAELEAAFGLDAEADVDDLELGQLLCERGFGSAREP